MRDPNQLLSWRAFVLPFLDQTPLWEQSVAACEQGREPYLAPPHVGYRTVVPVYARPSDGRLAAPLKHPSGDLAAFTSYMGVSGAITAQGYCPGVFGDRPGIRLRDVPDGTSQTLAVGERPPPDSQQAGRWYAQIQNGVIHYADGVAPGPDHAMLAEPLKWFNDYPCRPAGTKFGPGRTDNPCDRYHFWSLHAGGANLALVDGSVRFLRYTSAPLIPTLATRSGGESVTPMD